MADRDDTIHWPKPGANRSPSPRAPRPEETTLPPVHRNFQQTLQEVIDKGGVYRLEADVTVDQPVVIEITHSHRGWFGLDGQHHKIYSTVQGRPALSFVMPENLSNVCARGFFLGNLTMIGSGQEEGGLMLDARAQNAWLVNAHLENLWIE